MICITHVAELSQKILLCLILAIFSLQRAKNPIHFAVIYHDIHPPFSYLVVDYGVSLKVLFGGKLVEKFKHKCNSNPNG